MKYKSSEQNRNMREPLRGKKSFRGKKLPECRWCHSEITGLRRSFCSDACVHEHKLRSDVSYMRTAVFERDHGMCAICKRDCEQLKIEAVKILLTYGAENLKKFLKQYGYPNRRIKLFITRNGAALWDADHITPVVWGGGGCGLDEMRTLCVPCHDLITHDQRRMTALGISAKQNTLWNDDELYLDINKNDK